VQIYHINKMDNDNKILKFIIYNFIVNQLMVTDSC